MGRDEGLRGRRLVLLARVAAVVGVVCATGVAVAAPAMAEPNLIAGTPCTSGARACVDLVTQKAWLIGPDGKVLRGPVAITSGGPGQETPPGTFHVMSKDATHKSNEYKTPQGLPAPMPWSTFFAPGGIAFHGGSLVRASAGCVHLSDPDAQAFFNSLQVGDQVQVQQGGAPAPAKKDDEPKPSESARPPSSAPAAPNDAPGNQPKPSQSAPASAGNRQPGADGSTKPSSALDLNRSPVDGGALPHGL
jgi:hypothetical protein